MTCRVSEEQLWSWIDRDAPELEEHLAACPSCRARAAELRAEIETLAAGSTRSGPPLPRKIGSYLVKRLLGEGGQGLVYEAEQQTPRRPVALKVLKGGRLVGQHDLRHFQREVQTLARLKHSSIATIYEAGRTTDGQQFFAMELVRGVPLTEYVRAKGLPLRDRLELFGRICQAINYAHQRGVIHRDLKPSNIIIDAEGHPRILDFGLARITDADVAVTTTSVEVGKIMGTLPYMSPEQARGDPDHIDVRSDIYSLGVILYALTTEQLPYDVGRAMLPEAVRVICEQAPQRPSTVNPALRGDLETITLKALEKEPARRYQSAAALAEDLDRYQSNQPILARPPSTAYQLRKLVARHKLPIAFAAMSAVVVTAFAVVATVQAFRIAEERNRAIAAEQVAEDVSAFLVGQFDAYDLNGIMGSAITAREILDKGAEKVRRELKDQPETQAKVMNAIGMGYKNLGLYEDAASLLESALAIGRSKLGEEHSETIASMNNLAALLTDQGKLSEAESLFRQGLETARRVLGKEHLETIDLTNGLTRLLYTQGKLSEAESLVRQTLQIRRRALGEEHPDTLMSMNNLAALLKAQGHLPEAESLYRQTLATSRRTLGEDDRLTLTLMNNLATLLEALGKPAEAEPLLRQTLESCRRLRGDEHPDTLASMNNLAGLLKDRGKLSEAGALYRQVLETRRDVLGDEHHDTLTSMNNLAVLLKDQGQLSEAESLFRRTLETRRRILGHEHPKTLTSMNNMAFLLQARGKLSEGETLLREALAGRRKTLPAGHPAIANSLVLLGMVLLEKEEPQSAEPVLRECLQIRRQALPEGHWLAANTESILGECLAALGRYVEAEPLLLESYPVIRAARGETHERTLQALQRIVDLYEARGQPAKAAEYLALLPESARPEESPGP